MFTFNGTNVPVFRAVLQPMALASLLCTWERFSGPRCADGPWCASPLSHPDVAGLPTWVFVLLTPPQYLRIPFLHTLSSPWCWGF